MSFFLVQVPFRISFFGGGTDYPAWYRKEGGAVLSTTIDKYCYISCRFLPPFFKERHRVVWSQVENIDSIEDIKHPVVRKALNFLGYDDSVGLEIHHQADLPARAGMGSSSAFSVGMLKALKALKGQSTNALELAHEAVDFEQNYLQEDVGSQDQVAAACGGFNQITFSSDDTITLTPVDTDRDRIDLLNDHMMLVYTGISRFAPAVAKQVIANLDNRREVMREVASLVPQGLDIVQGDGDIREFGHLLDHAWKLKRQTADVVSNDAIDQIYATARKAGALGGKLLGAGAGGFLLIFAEPDVQPMVHRALEKFLCFSFRFKRRGASLLHPLIR
ncbi:galactokinase [Magnetospira thiophila]